MKTQNVFRYFWAVAVICALLAGVSYISGNDSTFDINVDDTYFVIAHRHLYTLLLILYAVPGLIYWLSRNLKLVKGLTFIHTIITVGGFIAYFILWATTSAMHNPESLFDNSMELFNIGITIIFLLATAVQPLLLINLTIGLVKRNR
ncbi:hypothetical protein ACX0HA_16825 [Flavobacterium hauense]